MAALHIISSSSPSFTLLTAHKHQLTANRGRRLHLRPQPLTRRRTTCSYKVVIEHEGRTTELEVDPDETILSKALDTGLDIPHDCKLGVCMTCPAKLLTGSVDQSEGMLSDDVIEHYPRGRIGKGSGKTLMAAVRSQNPRISEPQSSKDGIPIDLVKTLVKFKSRHNFIRVLEVSWKSDHPFAGSRLLLLDGPGNIHSISFLLKSLTGTYFDVFATFPPILPPGPLGILGFGAGSAARLILELYPQGVIHGWELDPAVISVAREYFGLSKLEKQYPDRLFVYIGNALSADIDGGFSGLLVDLFGKGCLIPELQDPNTWMKLKKKLRVGGRIMVNVGGSCVEAEDSRRDGKVIMEETLKAMEVVFPGEVCVLHLGNGDEDSSIAVTGGLPNLVTWKQNLPKSLKFYVDMWKPLTS